MITLAHLSERYGKHLVVDDMSLDVAAGFVGPNGAGKSTTMRMMVGLTRPDRGEVRYRGVRYSEVLRPACIVGSVLDARCMHPRRTASTGCYRVLGLGRSAARDGLERP